MIELQRAANDITVGNDQRDGTAKNMRAETDDSRVRRELEVNSGARPKRAVRMDACATDAEIDQFDLITWT